MKSIYALMNKPSSELSDFEKVVVESQKQAIKAKKSLEEKIGETSFGKFIDISYKNLSDEQKKHEVMKYIQSKKTETISLVYGLNALRYALLYLTNNKKTKLVLWQYQELLSFIKENYPQTVYGHDDINKGTSLLYRRIHKLVNELGIPLSKDVSNIINEGFFDERRQESQHRYMRYFGLDEKEAKRLAERDSTSFSYDSSKDSKKKLKIFLDFIKRNQENNKRYGS